MDNITKEIILGNWGGIRVNASIDERLEDIVRMIKYTDHGDDFLIVKTRDEIYKYGWFLNRRFEPDYDDLDRTMYNNWFIRKPKLFYAFDKNSVLSNEIYWKMTCFYDRMTNRVTKEYSSGYAQLVFDDFIKYMEDVSKRGITYNKRHGEKHEVERYLEANGISTEENLEKLNAVKWNSRIDGADGIAGKRRSSSFVDGDSIEFIWHRGEFIDISKAEIEYGEDNWCVETFSMDLDQFK